MQNISKEHAQYLRKNKIKRIRNIGFQIGILVFIIAAWEIFTRIGLLDSFIFSSPSRIIVCMSKLWSSGEYLYHLGVTLSEALIGLFAGVVLGLIIATLLWAWDSLAEILDPYLVVLNAMPKIALGPVIIVWAGAGIGAIIVMTLLISVIVTVMGVLSAFLNTSKEKILLMKTFGANKFQLFTKVVFPSNIPSLISALKINVGMTWVGVIMGEYLVSRAGLGYLIVYGGQVFKLDLVMSGVVTLILLASLMYLAVAFLEKKLSSGRYN